MMIEKDVLTDLVKSVQHWDLNICQASIDVIVALAKFSKLIYQFILCKN